VAPWDSANQRSKGQMGSYWCSFFFGNLTIFAVLQPHDHTLVQLCTMPQVQSLAE
jgi:hypothetical protein